MKQTYLLGTIVLFLSLVAGTPLVFAQKPPTSEPPPVPMRIRLVNLSYVVKNYKETKSYRLEVTDLAKKYEEELKGLKNKLEDRNDQLKQPISDSAKRKELEAEVKGLQGQIEEKTNAARKEVEEKEVKLISVIHKDIEETIRQYAVSNKLDLVLHYNAPDKETDGKYANTNYIVQKMGSMACVPIYMAPGVDISKEITKILNTRKKPGHPEKT